MNDEVQNVDPLFDRAFDRLVDGELSADERQQLLASLDDRAGGWRRCALAFLEAQTWRGEMRRIVSEPSFTKPPASSVSPYTKLPTSSVSLSSAASSTWLATAASLMLAFGLGWRMHVPAELGDADLIVKTDAPSIMAEAPPLAAPLPDGDSITLVVHDRNGQPQRVQVPLVEGERLGEQFGASPQWAAPEFRRQFADHGIDLQTRRRYAPLFFEQENRIVPMVVPVDDAVVTPVSRPIY